VNLGGDPDRVVRQLERDGVIACVLMAVAALAFERGRWDGAAGVLAGGALTGLSYWALKGAVELVVRLAGRGRPEGEQEPPLPAGARAGLAVKFLSRYALLAVGAYVMLTCFRVNPVGLLAGATTPFVAALVQTVRSFRAPSHRDRQ
jgi:hypothetical protein